MSFGAVAEGMAACGWVPGLVRKPPGLDIMASLHEGAREHYLCDLANAVAAAPPAVGGEWLRSIDCAYRTPEPG